MEEYLQQITRLMNLNGEAVEGMMVVNKDGIVEYYKPGNPFGKLPEEFGRNVVGNHLLSVYTELSEENSTVMNTLRTGQITVGEKQVLTHEDLQITMVTTTYPILNQQGEIQGAVDIAQILDVRSLKGAAPASADHSVLDDIVTRNKEMARLKAAIRTIAKNDSATLIYGETGTGKGVVVNAIHDSSPRRDTPLVKINCGAIPESLLESELFGYEKGAFTGANKAKKGLMELANGGTVFLDEIGELPLAMQSKLLTFLEDRRFKRVGGLRDIEVNVRIIAATNRDLDAEVQKGAFREDLYYRLNVMQIRIPPLRERREDIPVLARYYLEHFNRKFNKHVRDIAPAFLEEMERYSWKGNVRELRNVMERCVLFSQGELLTGEETGLEFKREDSAAAGPSYPMKDLTQSPIDLKREVDAFERAYIDRAMELSGGNSSRAAQLLGCTRFTLKRRLEQSGEET